MSMRKARTRKHARQRGIAATELAILTPVLMLLTLAAFELGRAMWIKHTLSHLARETARWASVRSIASDEPATTSSLEARAKRDAVGIDSEALVVEPTWTPTNRVGATVRVQLRYDFAPVTPLLPFESIELTSNSQRIIAY